MAVIHIMIMSSLIGRHVDSGVSSVALSIQGLTGAAVKVAGPGPDRNSGSRIPGGVWKHLASAPPSLQHSIFSWISLRSLRKEAARGEGTRTSS